jgi:Flp pilus assembly protein TadD
VRRLVLAILLVGYAVLFVRFPAIGRSGGFEPLDPRGRQAEAAIEEGRFADALPIVRELARQHDSDPVILYWLAEVHRGLGQSGDEARAWEHVLDLTGSAEFVCPSLPEAYARAGDRAKALDAYERCASAGADDPERWLDLGTAYAAAHRDSDAEAAFEKSRVLDDSNPRLPAPVDEAATAGRPH